MSDFDDAIGDMTEDLLTEAGGSFVYRRGSVSTTITLNMQKQPSELIEVGGIQIQIHPIDFKGLTSSLPYDPPMKGDIITGGGKRYEVQPTTSEVVHRRISPKMTRIHAKQIE